MKPWRRRDRRTMSWRLQLKVHAGWSHRRQAWLVTDQYFDSISSALFTIELSSMIPATMPVIQSEGSDMMSAKARMFKNAKSLRLSPKLTCEDFAHLHEAVRRLHALTDTFRKHMCTGKSDWAHHVRWKVPTKPHEATRLCQGMMARC